MKNWAGNISFRAQSVVRPKSTEEAQEIVRRSSKMRVVGSGHSFNPIADTKGTLMTLADMPSAISVNPDSGTVSASGGTTYAELIPALSKAGRALSAGASLPHITLAGAIATATHGSGNANQNLSAAVQSLTLIRSDGELLSLKRGERDFDGAVVSLGALGTVIEVSLDTVPAYDLSQTVFTNLPIHTALENFDAVTGSAYSVSLFTRWAGESIDQVWQKSLTTQYSHQQSFYGATPASKPLHPIAALDGTSCTPQGGTSGPWHERLFHFPASAVPSAGNELQSEYFVDRQHAPAAFKSLYEIQSQIAPALLISEIRTIAADNLWLSPSHNQNSVGFHFTWQPDADAVSKSVDAIEAALAPLNPRPHWAKIYNLSPADVRSRYPRFRDFNELANHLDPDHKFRNSHLDNLLG